jgi:hypothetical protein
MRVRTDARGTLPATDGARAALRLLSALALSASALGCRDLGRFSSAGDSYEGPVVNADFVLANVAGDTRACVTLDTDHLQDAPGHLSTSDGRFHLEPLRPIPQVWHDPLSTLTFGEGREKNLLYVASPEAGFADGGDVGDVFVVLSLMSGGDIEVRTLRGAPPSGGNLFAVFHLTRQSGPCSY